MQTLNQCAAKARDQYQLPYFDNNVHLGQRKNKKCRKVLNRLGSKCKTTEKRCIKNTLE
jgi:hypothetical protein